MKKQTVFIKVLVDDRLPTVKGSIIGQCGDIPCLQQFYFDGKEFKDLFDDHPFPVKWWLEEIELPSEDELNEKSDLKKGSSMWFHSQGFTQGANFILNHLKSNTNETEKR